MSFAKLKTVVNFSQILCNRENCNNTIQKNRGASHFAAHRLHVGNIVGYPWESCHANQAVHYFHIWKQWAAHFFQIWKSRLISGQSTTFKYRNSGQFSGLLPFTCKKFVAHVCKVRVCIFTVSSIPHKTLNKSSAKRRASPRNFG